MTVFLLTFTEREKIYNLCESLTGARFTTSYTRIGGVSRDTPPGWCDAVRKFLNEVVVNIAEVETLLTRNRIWVDRTRDVGVISKADAIDYGLSGPNLRGSGVDYDLRKAQPYLCYQDLQFDVPLGSVGDCYDRYLVRMEEMRQSVRILHQCLDKIPGGFDNQIEGAGQRGRRQNRFAAEGQGHVEHGGVDSPVHARDARHERAARRNLFRPRESRRANSVFTSTAAAAARRTG